MQHERILILDFGSQYTQLIARRIREINIYCEIHPFNKIPEITSDIKGVILSGSPFSVLQKESPSPDLNKIKGHLPVLGICYGAQYLVSISGGKVLSSKIREYGRAYLSNLDKSNILNKDISNGSQVWMSHGDTIQDLPHNFKNIASTEDVKVAGYQINNELTFGIQFHPEVYHTEDGKKLLYNFLIRVCNCSQDWSPNVFVETTINNLRKKLGKDKVVLGLSGGVDSTVAAVLLHKAIGHSLHCIFVNNGLLRKNEFHDVLSQYKGMDLNVIGVNASDYFYQALKGIEDPELKRKAIGNAFVDIFNNEANRIKDVKWLAQGTIYPDVIESVSATGGPSATIKSHHNVGGLPENMKLKIIEPLKNIF